MRVLDVLVLVPALIVVFFVGRKAYWDYRVSEMCARDGGTVVIEPVTISQSEFLAWGGQVGVRGVPIPHEDDHRVDIPIFRRTTDTIIHDWNPTVSRYLTEFVRRSDGKILGSYTYYSRRGGDLPSWAHESSFGCAHPDLPSESVIVVVQKGPQAGLISRTPNIPLQGTLRDRAAQRP